MNNKELVILAGKKQGGGSVTPASIVTATSQMTAQQASDTLDNIGGEPEKLIVTVTYDALNDEYTADKTFEEIIEAVDSGKSCEVHYGNLIFPMVDYDEDGNSALFCIVRNYNQNAKMYQISTLDDEWYYRERVLEDAPTTVTDLSSTSITLASAADNTIYEYGELTALTVTAITATGDFIIRFTSGATPTTTSFPVSMKFPESFAPEANTRYEINVEDGYAVAVGWPVS